MDTPTDASWEERALEMRNEARQASRHLRKTLEPPAKLSRTATPCLRAGVARRDITPSEPMHLDGYWSDRLSTEVHDPLSVRAIVFDDGRTRVAFVVADLIAYYNQWVVKARLMQDAVPPGNVVICTTHNHSAPCVLGMFGPPGCVRMDYVDDVASAMAEAIKEAAGNLRPVRVGFGESQLPVEEGEIPDFARNWHNPGVVDPTMLVMRVLDAGSGAPVATLVNLGNHPDVLGEYSTVISADFLGYVYETVSNELGGETLVFERGLGGVEPIPQGIDDLAEAETHMKRVSDVACAAILEAADSLEWADPGRLTYRVTPCEFPLTSGEALKAYASGLIPIETESAVQTNEMVLFEIGPAQFLTVPGEPHPEVVFKLADMMRGRYRFVIAMAQDEVGYVVPKEIFNPAGIQELLSTGKDNELVVLSAARRLLGVDGFVEPDCLA